MRPGIRTVALVTLLAAVAYTGFRVVHHAQSAVIPPLVMRDADAAALVSESLSARLRRFMYDHYPAAADRTGNPRLVALTFDDGPYPVETPLLLDELADLHVPATFFLIGRDTEMFPQLAKRIEAAGHEIANHTLTHPAYFDELPPSGVDAELRAGASTLERYVHDPAIRTMMRPPHGRFTLRTLEAAQHDGYDVILWNDDPGDWRSVSPQRLLDHMESNATAPEIVLLHSGRMNSIDALPEIVARFRAAGFSFVTVGELLRKAPVSQILHPEKLRV